MAHRIYLYNYDQKTNQSFDTYLGEWNYEIPLLLYPLIAENIQVQGVEFFSDKEQGIIGLRSFFNLLADTYQLHYKKVYYEAVNNMFEFLEALPYDSFVMNATDVFNMNEEKHREQAKEWLLEIQQKSKLYKKAIRNQNLSLLDGIFSSKGYSSFLEILQTDWINYGLGYFEETAYKKVESSIFEETGKFGLKNAKGEILAPAIYDEIFEEDYHYRIAIVMKEGLFGYLQSDGKEVIPPIYEDAFDIFDFDKEPLGKVKKNGKMGVLRILSKTWLIPADYDTIEQIHYGFLGLEKNEEFEIYSNENGIVFPNKSTFPFEYDYFAELFFTKEKGTSKRKYYTKNGVYIGDFLEGSIIKASTCFWVKPNKFNKKSKLIDKDGNIIIDELDQLILIDNFETFAVRKEKVWKIYNSFNNQFLLQNELIVKVKTPQPNMGQKNNVFVLKTEKGLGFFDANTDCWLVEPQSYIKQIHYLENGFLSIETEKGYQLFDAENGLSTELYDYISNPLNYRTEEGLLFLYKEYNIFRINEDKSIQLLGVSEYGTIYLDRYSFRGKDLEYFILFYTNWKKNIGNNSEQLMSTETITRMAFEAKDDENYEEALRLFQLAANKNDCDSLVEIGLLLTDPEIESLFDPMRGIKFYEKAAQQNHAAAWNNIGALYQNGIGYSYNIKKAIKYFEKAVELGDGMALNNLADLYYFGEHVKQNYEKALNFYKKAEKKLYYNYDKISEIYYQLRDYENLLIYLKKDYDNSYSHIYYGIIYEHGMGVKEDIKKAIKHFEKANNYSVYEYATQRLVYYFGEDPLFRNEKKFQKWKTFAEEHGFEN